MKITYYGHSCFLVEENNSRILFDPYEDESVPGLTLPKGISVDAVYCSHEHADHNAAHLVHTENKEPFPKEFIVVPHDHHDGKKRGMNRMTIVNIHGIRLAHLGDIERDLAIIVNTVKAVQNKTDVVSSLVSSLNERVANIGVIIGHKADEIRKAEEERGLAELKEQAESETLKK